MDPTVRRNTRPVLPVCGENVPSTSSAIYEDSDGQFYSFNEGAPLSRVQTMPSTTSLKRMKKKKTSSQGGRLSKACNEQLSPSSSSNRQMVQLPDRPVELKEKHFLMLKSEAFTADNVYV